MTMPRSAAHRRPAEQLEAGVAGPGRQLGADEVDGRVEGDVLVVHADLGLGRRREHRLRQLGGLLQAARQRLPCIVPVGLVLLPRRAGEAAADDALDRRASRPAAEHHPPGQLGVLGLGRAVGEVGGDQVVAEHVAEVLDPEGGHGREHPALVRDRLGHDDVEGGQPVGGDHQQVPSPAS